METTGLSRGFEDGAGVSCILRLESDEPLCGVDTVFEGTAVDKAATCCGATWVGVESPLVETPDCRDCQACWSSSSLVRRSICNCCAASASFNDWTSAAVTVVGAGAGAAAGAAGLPDAGLSAKAPTVRTA